MGPSRLWPRLAAVTLLVSAAAPLGAQPFRLQPPFRVEHTVARQGPEQIEVTGTVFNQSRDEVLDVSVTAEALDASGKVVARGISFVSPRIPGGQSAPFTAKVPTVPSVSKFRVSVTSFRAGLGAQPAPGLGQQTP